MPKRQKKATSFFDTAMNKDAIARAGEALVCFCIVRNIEFDSVEDVYFDKFLRILRPTYVRFNSEELINCFLDRAYEGVILKTSANNMLKVLFVHVMKSEVFGNELKIISTVTNEENQYLFVNVEDIELLSVDYDDGAASGCIQSSIQQSIEKAKSLYNLSILTVLQNSTHELPAEITHDYKEILIFQCHAGYINQLKELMIDCVLENQVKSILRKLEVDAIFKKNKYTNYNKLLGDFDNVLEAYSDHLITMRRKAADNVQNIDRDVFELLFKKEIEEKIKLQLHVFKSIFELESKITKRDCTISDAVEHWLDFYAPQNDEDFKSSVEGIMDKCMVPAALASNYLNPLYKGREF